MLSRTMRMRYTSAAAAASLVRNARSEIAPRSVGCVADAASRHGFPEPNPLGSTPRHIYKQMLLSGLFGKRQGGVQRSGEFCQCFYSGSTGNQAPRSNGNSSDHTFPEGISSSGSVGERPSEASHSQSSLVADDFRSLIVSKKREVAILEAALEMLETAPRNKWFQDLVQKHNIQLGPSKSFLSLSKPPLLKTDATTVVIGDLVGKRNIQSEPAPQALDSSNGALSENTFFDVEPVKATDSQLDRPWDTPKLESQKTKSSAVFDKLSLDDFPSPQDPNHGRLQKKWRRLGMMEKYERNSRNEPVNFGTDAKNTYGGSRPGEESSEASSHNEQRVDKPYKSLADRLYEEHFGRPAPPGLKRTYPKGSFYDRCMKKKEQEEKEAAQAGSPPTSKSVSSLPTSRSTEAGVSVSSHGDEINDNVHLLQSCVR
ncbi:uncharacterized protein [Physcomitrium patens]|uniref:Uncharacterized protein n=1 Tax=Physcomitrium patens TaxID=3218 RepID=A0A7I4EKL6_PHYPA|nr:uncharacterized protein LOC112286405 isoform X2 [Physcomitrium patens]|eukprot:XP_024384035.1 uncharacterized protein LOC112286405 isoform X2 [Physcomitrella patens]